MFSTILILFGLGLGFVLFVYIASGVDNTRRKIHPLPGTKAGKDRMNPMMVFKGEWKEPIPRPRICPICGTFLDKEDFLYAAMEAELPSASKRKRQARIYGCPYCYSGKNKKLTKDF